MLQPSSNHKVYRAKPDKEQNRQIKIHAKLRVYIPPPCLTDPACLLTADCMYASPCPPCPPADRQAVAKITPAGLFVEELERNPARFMPDVAESQLGGETVKVRGGGRDSQGAGGGGGGRTVS